MGIAILRTSKNSYEREEDCWTLAVSPPHSNVTGSNPCRACEACKAESCGWRDGSQEYLDAWGLIEDFVDLIFMAGVAFDGHCAICVWVKLYANLSVDLVE